MKDFLVKSDFAAAVPLFQRAIGLDPNFALAYNTLGASYGNLGENILAAENERKAFELRGRVSEREKFEIESAYYYFGSQDLEKALQSCELWAQTYPRDEGPRGLETGIYLTVGQFDKALLAAREHLRLAPTPSGIGYAGLVDSYLSLNRLEDARAAADEAQAKNLDSPYLRFDLYRLAFLQNDTAGMARQVAWASGKRGFEDVMLNNEANTAAYFGQLQKAREFSQRADSLAAETQKRETATVYEAVAAVREALFGNTPEARKGAASIRQLLNSRDVQYGISMTVAFAGDSSLGEHQLGEVADDLGNRFPDDTLVKFNYLPTLQAQIAINRHDPLKAIGLLQVPLRMNLGHGVFL
jgi:eukaryotic-like serine/threonine-protein kinase